MITEDCIECQGRGFFEVVDINNADVFRKIECSVCFGTGKISS